MLKIISSVLLLFCFSVATQADIKISAKNSAAGHSSQSTTYIKGARQRLEQGFGITMIYQCDQKRMIQINDNGKRYLITPLEGETTAADNDTSAEEPANPPEIKRRGGIVTFNINISDTGERKQMFGYTARHIISTMTKEATPDACDPGKMRMETDGWYIDLEYGLYCSTERPALPMKPAKPDCRDEIRFHRSGSSAKLGYPISLIMQVNSGEEGQTITTTMEVVELSTVTLAPALFDIPPGYSVAKNFQELFGVPAMPSITKAQVEAEDEDRDEVAAPESTPKRPGAIRIGVVSIYNKSNSSISTASARNELIQDLGNENIDAIRLEAPASPQVETEAAQKDCDYILFTDIAEVKKPSIAGKIGGLLGRSSGADIVKEKHEANLEFRLFRIGTSSPQLRSNAAAKEEGAVEAAILSALSREAKAVANEVRKKR